ncbi:tyrosine-type recombinase/integrase [Agromyces cerinus subsp. nitratus]
MSGNLSASRRTSLGIATCSPKGFYRYTFKPAARRAGFPELHLHELRHTFATLALESKALDMHELSRAMGHASYEIADRVYAHLRKKDYSSHRARFSAHVAAARATPPQQVRLRAAGDR